MKLKIVGSGGMFPIPNPFCRCPICEEARLKRGRYQRLGPSLYIEDIQMLIDTPEDIAIACERPVSYTHLLELGDAIRMANAVGALSTTAQGAQAAMPTMEQAMALLN